jgi:hypothetical protein
MSSWNSQESAKQLFKLPLFASKITFKTLVADEYDNSDLLPDENAFDRKKTTNFHSRRVKNYI